MKQSLSTHITRKIQSIMKNKAFGPTLNRVIGKKMNETKPKESSYPDVDQNRF